MASSVRAVALAALVEQGKAGHDEMQHYHPHVPWMNLFTKAQYLNAARQVSGTAAIIKDVTDKIMAHADETGGKLQRKLGRWLCAHPRDTPVRELHDLKRAHHPVNKTPRPRWWGIRRLSWYAPSPKAEASEITAEAGWS